MFTLKMTSQFKKDLKRIQNNPKKIAHLKSVLFFLQNTGLVPENYNPHKLTGNYSGFMECHVENDLLLICVFLSFISII